MIPTWMQLADFNHLAHPNLLLVHQLICIPDSGASVPSGSPHSIFPTAASWQANEHAVGTANPFAYGQCTWWANQRYYQLHGIFVPWTTNADAWQWTQRAQDFHWHVSAQPSVGAIIDLQPWVQGAYGLGHVAVGEKRLPNGDVLASTMNWGKYFWQITYIEVAPGPGVTFISF